MAPARSTGRRFPALRRAAGHRVDEALGGPGRLRMVLLLAGVLALNTADSGTVGAVGAQLEADLGIGHARLGLLATASAGMGAVATVPMGVLADRVNRVRLLTVTVAVWAVAMVASGSTPGYGWLLTSRLLLGAAVAAAGPVVVSLTGDLIPPADRAGVLGWILTGEIAGAGVGLLAGGALATVLSWRAAFFLLAGVSLVLAWALWRRLPEPGRGGAAGPDTGGEPGGRSQVLVTAGGVEPAPERTTPRDPGRLPPWRAGRYLLSIPTNRLLIVASSVGYFFFAGLRTFGVIFTMRHFHLSPAVLIGLVPVVGVAGLLGTVAGGRLADRWLRRGRTHARVVVPGLAYTAAALLFGPGVVLVAVPVALPFVALGAGALAAANPPLDAARLDIVPGSLWGRAESLRTLLRLVAEALAPAAFGLVADLLGGAQGRSGGLGLRNAFLMMLVPLLVNGLLMLRARHCYPVDVATAAAVDRRRAG
jgi:predicted MFS family arabinose efflux permease